MCDNKESKTLTILYKELGEPGGRRLHVIRHIDRSFPDLETEER